MRAMVKKTALNFPTRKGETRIQPPAGWVGAVRRPLGGRAAAVVGKSWQLRKRPLGAVDAAGQPRAAKKCARGGGAEGAESGSGAAALGRERGGLRGEVGEELPTRKGEKRASLPALVATACRPLGGRAAAVAKGRGGDGGGGGLESSDGERYFIGVCPRLNKWGKTKMWESRLWDVSKGKPEYLGSFDTREGAARAWCAAPRNSCPGHFLMPT